MVKETRPRPDAALAGRNIERDGERPADATAAPLGSEPGGNPTLPAIDSAQLFGHGNEVWIEHHGERYRLQRTRSGKLILTK